MTDFSQWNEYDGASEGSGASEKIWLINPITNEVGLFKYKKDKETTDHISECIAYKLSYLLDIQCAKFELGSYNGRMGSMSYRIVNDKQSLIEGINFIYEKYNDYNSDSFKDTRKNKMYSFEMIKESIESYIDYEDFLVIPIFDYLIGNSDRHHSNWALIYEDKQYQLSPLYDNSSSLCAYMNESELQSCLGKDKMKWKSIVETKSRSIIRINPDIKARPTHLEVLIYLKNNYFEETKELVSRIIDRINDTTIDDILKEYPDEQLLSVKKEVIKKFLLSKVETMKMVYFERE